LSKAGAREPVPELNPDAATNHTLLPSSEEHERDSAIDVGVLCSLREEEEPWKYSIGVVVGLTFTRKASRFAFS